MSIEETKLRAERLKEKIKRAKANVTDNTEETTA